VNVLSGQTGDLGGGYRVDGDGGSGGRRTGVDGDTVSSTACVCVISGASHAAFGIGGGHSCTIGQSVAAVAFIGVFGSCNGEPGCDTVLNAVLDRVGGRASTCIAHDTTMSVVTVPEIG
jgi:hypothetical protein